MSAKQTALQAYNEALGLSEPDDFFSALEQTYCIENKKDVPKDRLTQGKWKEWVGNASKRERRAWVMDAYKFAAWLIEHKAEKKVGTDKKFTLTMPSGFEELSLVIVFIVGDDDRFDEDGILMSETNARVSNSPYPTLALGSILSAFSTKDGPTFDEAVKGAWAAWVSHQEEYLRMCPDARNPFGSSVETMVTNRPIPAKNYTTAIMPRYAGSVIEVAHTDVESGSVLQSQEAEKALEKLNNQRDLFPPPERRLALIISQVQGLKETDHQGQVSQELRIFHEAYLATTGYDIGVNGTLVAFDFDYFRDALYPGWRDKRNKQGKPISFHTANRDRIRQSIDNMRKAYIDVDGLGPIAPVVSRTPVEKLSRGKDKVVLDVIAPSGTRRGGLIIANTMRQLGFLGGQGSARKYAFYHALVQYWDQHGTQNKKIIWPTIPKKLRDGEGRLIDEKGKVILDKNGKPETHWKKGVQVYDAKGEKIYEPNRDELLAYYPVVSRTELIDFLGVNRWSKTKALLDKMESEKVFVMEAVEDGYRFFPSIEHCQAHKFVRTSKNQPR